MLTNNPLQALLFPMTQALTLVSPSVAACPKPRDHKPPGFRPANPGDTLAPLPNSPGALSFKFSIWPAPSAQACNFILLTSSYCLGSRISGRALLKLLAPPQNVEKPGVSPCNSQLQPPSTLAQPSPPSIPARRVVHRSPPNCPSVNRPISISLLRPRPMSLSLPSLHLLTLTHSIHFNVTRLCYM